MPHHVSFKQSNCVIRVQHIPQLHLPATHAALGLEIALGTSLISLVLDGSSLYRGHVAVTRTHTAWLCCLSLSLSLSLSSYICLPVCPSIPLSQSVR